MLLSFKYWVLSIPTYMALFTEEESSKNSLIEGVEFWKDSTQGAF